MIEDVARSLEEAACALRAACERCESGSVRSVKRKHERFRVSVTRPRKGRDWDEWVLRVRGPGLPSGGRRERTHLAYGPASRAKAERLARAREREMNGDGLTVLEVYDRWLEGDAEGLAQNTLETRTAARLALDRSDLGDLSSVELSAARVQEFCDAMTGSMSLAASTASLYLRRVRQAWVWAGVRELVEVRWPDVPRIRNTKTAKRAYTGEELRDLLTYLREVCEGHYLALAAFLAETGCRVGEATQIPRDSLRVLEDGSGEIVLAARTRKIQRDHVVRISPGLVVVLGRFPAGAWLFPSRRDSAKHQTARSLLGHVGRWVTLRGLSGVLDVHSLRRSACGSLVDRGASLEKARRVTGQSAVTFATYAAKAEIDVSAEARLLWLDDEVLGLAPPGPGQDPPAKIAPCEAQQTANEEGSYSMTESNQTDTTRSKTPHGTLWDPTGPRARSRTALILPDGYALWVARILRGALGGDRA